MHRPYSLLHFYIDKSGVLSKQGQATAKNGLSVSKSGNVKGNSQTVTSSEAGSHVHTVQYGRAFDATGGGSNERYLGRGQDSYIGTSTTPIYNAGNHTHSFTFTPSISDSISVSLGAGDSETRPANYTIRIWKRTS